LIEIAKDSEKLLIKIKYKSMGNEIKFDTENIEKELMNNIIENLKELLKSKEEIIKLLEEKCEILTEISKHYEDKK